MGCRDPNYMNNLRLACQTVASCWGWDIDARRQNTFPWPQDTSGNGMGSLVYSVRWYKMVYCLRNFERFHRRTGLPSHAQWVTDYYQSMKVDFVNVRGPNNFDNYSIKRGARGRGVDIVADSIYK